MSLRVFLFALYISLVSSSSLFSMVRANKYSRNGQTVYIIGQHDSVDSEYWDAQENLKGILQRALNEVALKKQRKIQVLYEQSNLIGLTPAFDSPDIKVANMESRPPICSMIVQLLIRNPFLLKLNSHNETIHELANKLTFKDLIDEGANFLQDFEGDIPTIPTDFEKELAREQLGYCKREVAVLNGDIARTKWPVEKPLVELLMKMGPETSEILARSIFERTACFLTSILGRHILKSDPAEDIVIIANPHHITGIWQYLDSSQWSVDADCGDYHRLLDERDLASFMAHMRVTEKLQFHMRLLNSYAQQTVSTIYVKAVSYLQSLTATANQAE